MCVHERWLNRLTSVFISLFVISLDVQWHDTTTYALASVLSPKLPRCKVGDGPVKVDHGKKVTWVSCVCEGNGTCFMDVDRLLNWAALFPGHYNVINITCATHMTELAWSNSQPVGVVQDVVIKDCTLAKNTTLFAAQSPLEELWLENLGNEITKSIFEGIKNLESLLITQHKHNIMMDFITELPYLKHLTINGAGLNSLAPELFEHGLQYLDFNNNSISEHGLPNTTLEYHAFNMEDLYLDHNRINDLSNYTFKGRVKYLYLSKNGLHSIHNQTFSELKILRELDLSSNVLTSLPGDVFKNLDYLYRISLADNQLTKFPSNLFHGLRSLRYLNMGGNNLTVIPGGAFPSSLNRLRNVHLHGNNLDEVPTQVLQLPFVDTVDLSNNIIHIRSLRDIFINPKNPSDNVMVDLRQNNITHIPVNWSDRSDVDSLVQMMSKVYYDFSENAFHCDCAAYSFHRLLQTIQNASVWMKEEYTKNVVCATPSVLRGQALSSLSVADLVCPVYDHCPERCHCRQHYDANGQMMVTVNCSHVGMKFLPETLPLGTRWLYLDHNAIQHVDFRPYLSGLLLFTASYNNISVMDDAAMKALSNAEYVSLHHNSLLYLPRRISELNMTHFSLHDNPLRCDCHALWLRSWILRSQDRIEKPASVQCVLPPGEDSEKATVRPMMMVDEKEFVCLTQPVAEAKTSGLRTNIISTTAIVVITVAASLSGIVCGAVFIACRRRHNYAAASGIYHTQSCQQSCQRCPRNAVQCVKQQTSCAGINDDLSDDLHPLHTV